MKFQYSPAADLTDPLIKRLGRYPRVPDMTIDTLRWLGSTGVTTLLKWQFRLEVTGELPEGERVALLANHQSHLDTVTLLAALPARRRDDLVVLAAEDYFFHRADRAIAASLLCRAVAFDRLHRSTLRQWKEHLKNPTNPGWILVYPSGSRSSHHLQAGLIKLLVASGWTMVPVRVVGTREAWPVGKRFWRPFGHLKVSFLPPLTGDATEMMQRLEQDLS